MDHHMHIYANTLLPIPNDVVLDKRLRNVVDHERLVREHLHKLLRHCEVLRVDKDVVGEIVLLQKTDSTQKVLAKEEGVVRFILNLSCYYNTEAVRCDEHPSAWGSVRRTQATVRVRDDAYALVDILRTKIHPSDNPEGTVFLLPIGEPVPPQSHPSRCYGCNVPVAEEGSLCAATSCPRLARQRPTGYHVASHPTMGS